nr:hypothetical protein [Tanacetum cinerariifolium]
MAETIEQYISKTQADYELRVARPKIKDKDNFKLKGQFLKELRTNTFNDLDHEDAKEHIEKVFEIVNLFHIPDITIDQVILRSFPMSLTGSTADAKVATQEMAKYSQKLHNGTSRTRSTKTSDGLAAIQAQLNNLGREIKKVDEKVYAAQVGCEQRKGGYRETASGFYQRNDGNPSYQERRQSMEETLSKFIGESEKRHEENSNLIKEIRALTDAAIRNQRASIKTLEIQTGKMSKVLQEREFGSLPSSTKTNLRDHVKSISTIVEVDASSIRRIGSQRYAVYTGQNNTPMYETRQTTISFPSRLNDCYCEEKKGSYGSSLDPFFKDYIELNDLIVPLELRRDQVDDLMPTIEEGEVVEEFRARNDARLEMMLEWLAKFLDILVIATTIKRSVLIVPTT